MDPLFEKLTELLESGTPFVMVTLVEATGSTPQDRGSKMLVTREGRAIGTIGGGRSEHTAITKAQEMLADPEKPKSAFIEWNLRNDLNMVCGGAVKLFFEAYNQTPWQITIFGAGHVANALVRLLLTLECQITVFDHRQEWLDRMPSSPKLRKNLRTDLPAAVSEIPENSFVALMTMGHATDTPILLQILKTRSFPYIGVIGSKSKAAEVRKKVLDSGLTEDDTTRYVCPIGLPLGTNHPGEIAVSIAGQLIQRRDEMAAKSNEPRIEREISK